MLSSESDYTTEMYGHLIHANEETAKELPSKNKKKRKSTSKDLRVEQARKRAKGAAKLYHEVPNETNRDTLKNEKSRGSLQHSDGRRSMRYDQESGRCKQ